MDKELSRIDVFEPHVTDRTLLDSRQCLPQSKVGESEILRNDQLRNYKRKVRKTKLRH